MAAVTQPTPPRYNVAGSFRQNFYTVSGNTGDTLTVALNEVVQVNVQPGSTITAVADAVNPAGPGTGSVITFTASGAFTGASVEVIGH